MSLGFKWLPTTLLNHPRYLMPQMMGFEFLKRIRRDAVDTPV